MLNLKCSNVLKSVQYSMPGNSWDCSRRMGHSTAMPRKTYYINLMQCFRSLPEDPTPNLLVFIVETTLTSHDSRCTTLPYTQHPLILSPYFLVCFHVYTLISSNMFANKKVPSHYLSILLLSCSLFFSQLQCACRLNIQFVQNNG